MKCWNKYREEYYGSVLVIVSNITEVLFGVKRIEKSQITKRFVIPSKAALLAGFDEKFGDTIQNCQKTNFRKKYQKLR
jgi:hypothetical protein